RVGPVRSAVRTHAPRVSRGGLVRGVPGRHGSVAPTAAGSGHQRDAHRCGLRRAPEPAVAALVHVVLLHAGRMTAPEDITGGQPRGTAGIACELDVSPRCGCRGGAPAAAGPLACWPAARVTRGPGAVPPGSRHRGGAPGRRGRGGRRRAGAGLCSPPTAPPPEDAPGAAPPGTARPPRPPPRPGRPPP